MDTASPISPVQVNQQRSAGASSSSFDGFRTGGYFSDQAAGELREPARSDFQRSRPEEVQVELPDGHRITHIDCPGLLTTERVGFLLEL